MRLYIPQVLVIESHSQARAHNFGTLFRILYRLGYARHKAGMEGAAQIGLVVLLICSFQSLSCLRFSCSSMMSLMS